MGQKVSHTYKVVNAGTGADTGHNPLSLKDALEVRSEWILCTRGWFYLISDDGRLLNTANDFDKEMRDEAGR